MSKKNNKASSGFSGWTLLAAAIGAGIGYGVNKLIQSVSEKQSKKQQPKLPIQSNQSKIQVTKTTIENYDQLEDLMICPITHQIMTQPYILTPCGHTFQKNFIKGWVQKSGNCPLCKTSAKQSDIQINFQLKQLIHYYQYNKNNKKIQAKPQSTNN